MFKRFHFTNLTAIHSTQIDNFQAEKKQKKEHANDEAVPTLGVICCTIEKDKYFDQFVQYKNRPIAKEYYHAMLGIMIDVKECVVVAIDVFKENEGLFMDQLKEMSNNHHQEIVVQLSDKSVRFLNQSVLFYSFS